MRWRSVVVRETSDPQVAARWFEQTRDTPTSTQGPSTVWVFQPVKEIDE